jgi:phage tail sheath gpL-like
MNQKLRVPALLVTVVALTVPVLAHHGTGVAYDSSKPTVVKGMVTDFAWKNPHAQLFLDVKDESGNVQQYAVEMNSPGVMTRQGWTKRQFKVGDEVSITVYPAKSGARVGSCIGTCKAIINGTDATPKVTVEDR